MKATTEVMTLNPTRDRLHLSRKTLLHLNAQAIGPAGSEPGLDATFLDLEADLRDPFLPAP
jgi:hypothetical protein